MSRSKNKKEEAQRPGRPSAFPGDRVRAGAAMHVLVCGIDPCSAASRLLRPPPCSALRPSSRYTGVRMLEKSRNRLTLSHFVSREKRLPSRQTRSASRSLVMISNPDPAFSASQKASWDACLGKCPDNRFPCSLSPEVLHVRTTNPLEKDRFTRSCRCRRELRSWPQGKLGKRLPSPKYAADSLT